MKENDLEEKVVQALACLDFLVGVLSRTASPLDEHEVAGLVSILTDILEVFEEAKTYILATKVPT